MQSEIKIFFDDNPVNVCWKKKNLIDLRYLLLAVRIFNLPPFPGLWRGLVQLIHAEVTRIFITFPSGRGLVQTRIPSVISVRVVISLGVRFSLKMKIIWEFLSNIIIYYNFYQIYFRKEKKQQQQQQNATRATIIK